MGFSGGKTIEKIGGSPTLSPKVEEMRTLELYSGTKSFTKGIISEIEGAETTTIDILPKFSPTICEDILEWDYKIHPPHYYDIIWASPPCQTYSKANRKPNKDYTLSDKMVARAFEIINYYKPKVWIMENPATGKLPERIAHIDGFQSCLDIYEIIHWNLVDYCPYGKPYKKSTMLWSNIEFALELCKKKGLCPQMTGNKHNGSCGNGCKKYNKVPMGNVWAKDEIPPPLIKSVITQILATLE